MVEALFGLFSSLEDWVQTFLHLHALIGPSLLLLIEESGIPLPVPGDIIIAYSGYQVSGSQTSYYQLYLSLVLAALSGAAFLYTISYFFGQPLVLLLGRYIRLDEGRLERVEKWFKKYGIWVIILGRHIPGFRIPITIFAGISKVSPFTFLAGTFITISIWVAVYLYLGVRLGSATLKLIHAHQGFFSLVLIPVFILLAYFFFFRKKEK